MFNFAAPPREPVAAAGDSGPRGLAIDWHEMLGRLRRRVVLILASGLAGLVLALVVLSLLSPVYTAQTQLLIDPADLRIVENGVTPNSQHADSGLSIAESQVRVVSSDSVLRRVVTRLGLASDPEFARPLRDRDSAVEIAKRILGFTSAADLPDDPELRAMASLRRNLVVRRPERTFVIEILVRSGRGDKAARIANAVADAYFAEEAAARASSAGRASDSLAARLNELRSALQTTEDKLARYREEKGLVSTNGRLLVDQRLGDLNAQLAAASIKTAEARVRADQARRLRGDGHNAALPELLQSTELRALRQQHADLARQNAEMLTRLGARHPLVVEQHSQMRELERVMAREKTRIIDATVKELDRAVAAENAIRAEIDRLKRETSLNERALIGLRELERDVETQKAIYEAYLKRARETGQQERLDTTNMRVISPASQPLARSWPPSPTILLPAALIGGLLVGLALALLLPVRSPRNAGLVVVSVSPTPARAS